MHSDAGECSVLLMLDLTSACDTVDHHKMLKRLIPGVLTRVCFGIVLFIEYRIFLQGLQLSLTCKLV